MPRIEYRPAIPALWAIMFVALLAGPAAAQDTSTAGSAAQDASGSDDTDNGGLKLSGNQPIQIESDKLEVHQNENKAIFTGNVNVVQGKTLMKAGRMIVYYVKAKKDAATGDSKDAGAQKASTDAASGDAAPKESPGGLIGGGSADIDHIEVDDKVYVKSDDQVATGDSGTFNMKTQILTLDGTQVVLTQGDNVVVGCKLVANLKTGQSHLDGCGNASAPGRVKMLLSAKKKPASE